MDAFTSWLSENGLTIFAILIAAVTVRGVVKFDLNQWLNDRREQREKTLRSICPHHYLIKKNEKIEIVSEFISPSGTSAWQCKRCGHISYDKYQDEKYWAENPNILLERTKQMKKLAKKLGLE